MIRKIIWNPQESQITTLELAISLLDIISSPIWTPKIIDHIRDEKSKNVCSGKSVSRN